MLCTHCSYVSYLIYIKMDLVQKIKSNIFFFYTMNRKKPNENSSLVFSECTSSIKITDVHASLGIQKVLNKNDFNQGGND